MVVSWESGCHSRLYVLISVSVAVGTSVEWRDRDGGNGTTNIILWALKNLRLQKDLIDMQDMLWS